MDDVLVGIVSLSSLLGVAAIPLWFGVRGVGRARREHRSLSNPLLLVLLGVAMIGLTIYAAFDRGF